MSESEEWYKRMLVLEGEIEHLKTILESHRTIFNDIHKRISMIEHR